MHSPYFVPEQLKLLSTKIEHIKVQFRVDVNMGAVFVNGTPVFRIRVRVKTALITISNESNTSWSSESKYATWAAIKEILRYLLNFESFISMK